MADISDVEEALAEALTCVLYPGGSSQSSIVGVLCRVYRGWPNAPTLNTDLVAGVVNVTIVTDNASGQITTRYLPEWQTTPGIAGTIASTGTQTISISGTPAVGDLVGALVDGVAYSYRVNSGDGVDQVAANINHSIQATRPARVQGSVITVPGANAIAVRVVCDNQSSFESRRQEKHVRVICWCPNPVIRDSVAAAIDYSLGLLDFLGLPDNTQGRIIYRNTESYDQAQNALLYRRDLVYAIEYPTVTVVKQPSMLFGASDTNGNVMYG